MGKQKKWKRKNEEREREGKRKRDGGKRGEMIKK